MNKTDRLVIRCTTNFKDKIQQLADKEGLSRSAYVYRLLKMQINEEVNTRGISTEVEGKE